MEETLQELSVQKSASVTPSLLVVDDMPFNLMAMKALLKGVDANVLTAGSGKEALELLEQHDVALVLLDVQMPEIDGYEVARRMHQAEHSKHTPIIFITANAREEENILKGYSAGAVDYIAKPVSKQVLKSKVGIFIDLYQQREILKRINKDLAMAKEAADIASAAKSQFLSNMSHELRTPMHAILNYAEMGNKKLDVPAPPDKIKLKKYFGNIHMSGSRLLKLLNNLLDLSHLESGKIEIVSEPGFLNDTIEKCLDELAPLLQGKGLSVNIRGQAVAAATPLSFDKGRIAQVVINVLSNAIRFSPEKANLDIAYSLASFPSPSGGEKVQGLMCAIADHGVGIPPEELESIFEQFTQSSRTRTSAGGTGLGLAICREIMEIHGGRIWAENNVDHGALFSLWLPQTKPA